jgi:thiol-disulfide isomerase/thioredoxin
MKPIGVILTFTILFFGFSQHDDKNPIMDYVQDGQAVLKFQFINVNDTSNCFCFYNTLLPIDQKVFRFQIYTDSVFEIKVNAGQPTIINFYSDSIFAKVLTLPGDTAFTIINQKQISFKGKSSKISDYLSKDKVYLYQNFPKKEESPEDYNLRIDSQYVVALKAFENHLQKEKLPEWFVTTEKTDIWLDCETLKQMQYNQRYWKYNQYIENKSVATNEIKKKELSLNCFTEKAFGYLAGVRIARYDTLLMPQHINTDIVIQYTRDNIKALNGRISDKMYSYFIAAKLSSTIRFILFSDFCKLGIDEKYKQIDELMNEMMPIIKDSSMMKFIVGHKENSIYKFKNQKKMQKGEKAPAFYLEDVNGTKVSLSDFKGKTILLNFWGTYCSPCISSIPQKNEFVQKFDKNQFVLINILMDYDVKSWRKIIEEKKFEGIHLKCKGNWSKLLKEKYLIKGVPHYTIIDKNGNLLVNEAKKDSLDYFIKSELTIK